MGCLKFGLFLALGTVCAAHICEPGDTMPSGKQTCFCLGDGSGWVCTDSPSVYSLASLSSSASEQVPDKDDPANKDVCTPGKTFPNYCNKCYCGINGIASRAACTKMYCDPAIWNKDGTTKIPSDQQRSSPLIRETRETEETCEPGKTFSMYCNKCICEESGLVKNAGCTRMYCDPEIWNKDGSLKPEANLQRQSKSLSTNEIEDNEHCEPGRVFKKFCNNCRCPATGLTAHAPCTRMYCDPLEWNRDGTIRVIDDEVPNSALTGSNKADDHCQPGSSFKKYCNTCVCGENGSRSKASCTRMYCDHDEWNADGTRKQEDAGSSYVILDPVYDNEERCQPGTTFKKYCNVCKCGTNGLVSKAACTRVLCDRTAWNRDGSERSINEEFVYETAEERPQPEERCTPGKSFKNYCNTCVCGSEGLVTYAKCTKEHCNHGLWYRNGTRKEEMAFIPMMRRKRSEGKIVCQPGRIFMKECNSCKCSRDGMESACTLMNCQSENEKPQVPQICEPGKRFKINCLDCSCSPDGHKISCAGEPCSKHI